MVVVRTDGSVTATTLDPDLASEITAVYGDRTDVEEVLLADDVLLIVANPDVPKVDRFEWDEPLCWWVNYKAINARAWNKKERTLLAMAAHSGKVLWQVKDSIAPVTLAADGRHVVYHDGDKVVCLDRASGKMRWESPALGVQDDRFPINSQRLSKNYNSGICNRYGAAGYGCQIEPHVHLSINLQSLIQIGPMIRKSRPTGGFRQS